MEAQNSRVSPAPDGITISHAQYDLFVVLLRCAPVFEEAVEHLKAYADLLEGGDSK